MSNFRRVFGAMMILALISVMVWLPTGPLQPAGQADQRSAAGGAAFGAPAQQEPAGDLLVSDPVEPFLTAALSDLPPSEADYTLDREINPRLHFGAQLDETYNPELGPDPLLAVQEAAAPAAPDAFGTPLLNFNGQGFTSVNPPDTVGDVGPNHYIQMINNSSSSRVTAYNKNTGAVIFGPATLSSLAPSGNPCSSGAGDPIVLHDQLANRWLLSEFASSGNNLCVYISQTADPGGMYYFYRFQTPNFPDYPKYAVWPDAYYVSSNESGGPAVYALDRTRMLAGLSATFQRRTAPSLSGFGFQALTPADLDGATAPPSGTPGLFMRHRDTEVHGPSGMPSNDLLEVWAFTVNWTTPASSSFSKIADIQVAEFDSALCGLTSFNCIAQPGTSTRLDPLREVIMWRLSYRNFGSRQVLVGNFSTDVGSDRAGVRWFELRRTSGNWGLFQEGTYAPGNVSRWMGGIAMDKSGNMALGYNVGSSSTYPGLRYVGRLAGDGAGAMPQGEFTIVNGSAANGSNRYGDYSSMNIDPADDCTFWFTGQWNDASQWKTRIAKLKFDQCTTVSLLPRAYLPLLLRFTPLVNGTVAGRVISAVNAQPISGAQVCILSSSQCVTTNAQGNYSIPNVQAGNQTVRAAATGYTTLQQSTSVPSGGTATVNFALSPTLAQGELRIVLTWGATPRDLDSHLWLPPANPYHLYYGSPGNCNAFPFACLDVDDVTSFGPETITIKQRVNGTYVYGVYNWSDEAAITSSGGRVQVYGPSGLVATYNVPTSGSGRWWYVFDFNGGTGALTPRNIIQSNPPGSYSAVIEETSK
ncbi:MAG: carboxypeptidase regulatory-like domain-containing protein [Anaerolineae bacterium]